ncbi:MAG TPA: acetylornithine deacetylase [Thermoanaerobaculia bacterium]|nr:acetylornithine deacetylase [Thermoanaerobaculia bacterium]
MAAALTDDELLRRLVGIDTTSHRSNLAFADLLADYLERPGVAVHRNLSAAGDKTNLVVRVGPPGDEASRAGLVLSGHMDVVPAGEAAGETGWTSDPFVLTDRGDRFVGRGSADMKGFLALATNLAREVDPGRLAAPLVLVFTYDEEVGTLGARRLAESWDTVEPEIGPLPRAAVIGEPTRLAAVRLHKGHLKLRLTFHGQSAHSGYPHLGRNAIEGGGRAIEALARLRRELEAESPALGALFPDVPYVALNVGTVRGGTAVNVVPERCVVEVGVRTLPGADAEALERRVRQAAEHAAAAPEHGDPVPMSTEILSESPPLETPAASVLHHHLAAALDQQGDESVAFATDAGWLARLGLECVIFGPGSIEVAHRPDEFVPKADLVAARRHLAGLVERFCVEGAA